MVAGRLEGKVALVMGAGAIGPGWGNGKASAAAFAREGARVACVDVVPAAATEIADLIVREGGEAIALACDATKADQVAEVVEACVARWGRIDILHNNIGTEILGDVVDVSEADWDRAFAINVKTALFAMKHAIPHMRARGGAIINISSMTALRHVGVAYASYYASKAALTHLTRVTAIDCAPHRIRVNAILPGMIKTPHVEHNTALSQAFGRTKDTSDDLEAMWRRRDERVPLGRMGDAWDVAWAAVFLASDQARYITGIELVIDGGMSLRVP